MTTPLNMTASSPVLRADLTATSTSVAVNGEGTISVHLGAQGSPGASLPGTCVAGPLVTLASAPVVPPSASVSAVSPNAGAMPGGTTIKVVGSNLEGARGVTVGGNACTSVQVLSPNVLTCVTPDGTDAVNSGAGGAVAGTQGIVDVVVTGASGTTSNLTPLDQFTYVNSDFGAIVSSVTPQAGTSAGGTPVTINGSGFLGAEWDTPGTPGTYVCSPGSCGVLFGTTEVASYTVVSDTEITTVAPAGSGIQNVTVIGGDQSTPSPLSSADRYNYAPSFTMVGSDGGVFSFGQTAGQASFFGSTGGLHLNKPIVGMAYTPDGGGYWLVAADGGVFAYGDAQFFGSAGNLQLNKAVVGMAATPDGLGYWLVGADGGVFGFGDAIFHGSAGSLTLAKPVVGMAATADGNGYWLVAADGGIFAYGDAVFHGSASGNALGGPIVGIAPTSDGAGYWLTGTDGGVFAYGSAGFYGSLSGQKLAGPISAITASPDDMGYWLTSQSGAVFNKGDAGFYGDMAGIKLNGPIVGASSTIFAAVA